MTLDSEIALLAKVLYPIDTLSQNYLKFSTAVNLLPE